MRVNSSCWANADLSDANMVYCKQHTVNTYPGMHGDIGRVGSISQCQIGDPIDKAGQGQ